MKKSTSIFRKIRAVFLLLLAVAAIAAAALFASVRHLAQSAFFHPSPLPDDAPEKVTPSDFSLRYQILSIRSDSGSRISAWWIPARSPKATVVVCPGSFETMADWVAFAPFFNTHRFNLLLWDYPGYARSAGSVSERSFRSAVRAAVRAAADFSPAEIPIALYGHGIGAALAADAASMPRVAGLVLEAPFASAADLARRRYPSLPLDALLPVSLDAAAALANLPGIPKLIAHSPEDECLPFASARLLADAAAAPKKFVVLSGPHGAHPWFAPDSAAQPALLDFLASLEPSSVRSP